MKALFWLAAIGAACVSNSASALSYVQTDSEAQLRGFDAFDASRGVLNKVTLDVLVSNKSRIWRMSVPAAQQESSATVGWTVDGTWELGSNVAAFDGLTLALKGTGSSVVRFDRLNDDRDRAFGYFDVTASGSGSFDLDPTRFTGGRVRFDGFDPGYYGNVGDTGFTNVPLNSARFQLSGACFVGSDGEPAGSDENLCGGVQYTLTYDYTPAAGAVPEPGTWALMLAGFASTGVALRRRRRAVAAA